MNLSRPLTHDEKKAAEAAFRGQAFNAAWSKSAFAVYDGILKARGHTPADMQDAVADAASPTPDMPEPLCADAVHQAMASDTDDTGGATVRHLSSRQEAIDAGLLVDVTPRAEHIGFRLAVALTRTLWERRITVSDDHDTPARDLRLRDMLLAVRLRLASLESPVPWLEVPVLFPSTEDEDPPTVFSIYALFHKDPIASGCLTLIHPKEFSSMRRFTRSDSDSDDDTASNDLP